jgi:hypothetical protein
MLTDDPRVEPCAARVSGQHTNSVQSPAPALQRAVVMTSIVTALRDAAPGGPESQGPAGEPGSAMVVPFSLSLPSRAATPSVVSARSSSPIRLPAPARYWRPLPPARGLALRATVVAVLRLQRRQWSVRLRLERIAEREAILLINHINKRARNSFGMDTQKGAVRRFRQHSQQKLMKQNMFI